MGVYQVRWILFNLISSWNGGDFVAAPTTKKATRTDGGYVTGLVSSPTENNGRKNREYSKESSPQGYLLLSELSVENSERWKRDVELKNLLYFRLTIKVQAP